METSCNGHKRILIDAQAKLFQTEVLRGLDCVALRVRGLKQEALEREKRLVDEEIEYLYPRILEWIKQCPLTETVVKQCPLTETVKDHNRAHKFDKSDVSFFVPKRKRRK